MKPLIKLLLLCALFCYHSQIIFATSGDLDTSFNSTGIVTTNIGALAGTNEVARAVVVDSSNNIVVAGTNGIDFIVARYLPNGLLDTVANGGTGFGPGGTAPGYVVTDIGGSADVAYGVAIDGSGNIVAAGTNGTNFAIVRYTSAGIPDISFGVGGDGIVTT